MKIEEIVNYIDCLPQKEAKFIYVTGCGGKTSLIRTLALHYAGTCRVTVAASAKMLLPDLSWTDRARISNLFNDQNDIHTVEPSQRDIHTVEPSQRDIYGVEAAQHDADNLEASQHDFNTYKAGSSQHDFNSNKAGLSQCFQIVCLEDGLHPDICKQLEERSNGICFMADRIAGGGRKMAGFGRQLQELAGKYSDIVLVEADGSRGIPLKGWEDYEPVLSDRADLVIAVMPLHVLGNTVNENTVFRLDRFINATGQDAGSRITPDTYIRLIRAIPGPFGNTTGRRRGNLEQAAFRRLLFLNRCESDQEASAARRIAVALGDTVDKVVWGSLLSDDICSMDSEDDTICIFDTITAVIPASGFSRRMGREKLLLPFRGKSLLANVLDAVCNFSWGDVIVCAARDEVIQEAHKKGTVRVVYNSDPSAGQSRSIVLAVQASSQSNGWLFTSADMPLLNKEIFRRIREAIALHPDKIIQARYQGHPGQPVYFPRKYREELLQLTGDTGGRQIISRHPESVEYIEIPETQPGIDVDTPEDYHSLDSLCRDDNSTQ